MVIPKNWYQNKVVICFTMPVVSRIDGFAYTYLIEKLLDADITGILVGNTENVAIFYPWLRIEAVKFIGE